MRSATKTILGLLAIAFSLGGCGDPRLAKSNEIRRQRIERHVKQYGDHDARGAERMKKTLEVDKTLRKERERSLSDTYALFRKLHRRDVQRWHNERDIRRERVRNQLRGKPKEIEDTWAKMIY